MEEQVTGTAPVVIGIDPGKQTGYAVYSMTERRLVQVLTTDFWAAYNRVRQWTLQDVHLVVVEVPDSRHVWHGSAGSEKANQRMGLHVGMAIREGELMVEGLRRSGYNVHTANPRGKVDAARFAQFTGWTARTSQHARDAALLCYGRRV